MLCIIEQPREDGAGNRLRVVCHSITVAWESTVRQVWPAVCRIKYRMAGKFREALGIREWCACRNKPMPERKNIRHRIIRSVFGSVKSEPRLRAAFKAADLEVLQRAVDAFGGPTGAGAWLASPALGLGGKIPILHAQTPTGKNEVMVLITRIDYGVY